MEFQVAGRCRPLSKFMEFLQDLILMANNNIYFYFFIT